MMNPRRYIKRAYNFVFGPAVILALALFGSIAFVLPSVLVSRGTATAPGALGRAAILATAVGFLLAGVGVLLGRRKARGLRAMTASGQSLPCVNCGYTLMLTEPRCPECGVVVDAADVRREWAEFRKRAGMAAMVE